jgi:hypothetical protein
MIWEYRVEERMILPTGAVKEFLDLMQSDGWELVSNTVTSGDAHFDRFIFRRKKVKTLEQLTREMLERA